MNKHLNQVLFGPRYLLINAYWKDFNMKGYLVCYKGYCVLNTHKLFAVNEHDETSYEYFKCQYICPSNCTKKHSLPNLIYSHLCYTTSMY